MKIALALIFVGLIAAVLISGCVQQGGTGPAGGGTTGTGGGQQLKAAQMEDQAAQAVQQEMDNAIGNITLEEIQNQLLQQG